MPEKITEAEFVIGIDPDVDKSGFAIFYTQNKNLRVFQYSLWDLFEELLKFKKPILVRLEAGWLIKKRNWNGGGFAGAGDVGRNHEIGRQIEKFCIKFNIPYVLIKPCGLSGINHATFCKITGWPIKELTNPEKRVAGLLAFNKKI